MSKTYVSKFQEFCIYGGQSLGMIRFANGRLTTSNPEAQRIVENSKWFKKRDIIVEDERKKEKTVLNEPEEEKEEEFKCDLCGKTFASQNALNGHRTVHYRSGELKAGE